ncbi:DUF1000-domain-containing protein [Panus rudis PR-1116 ss-1]|nr:DUF1000-domain-containing protein [Panus rudis PR-1116 ss-1]
MSQEGLGGRIDIINETEAADVTTLYASIDKLNVHGAGLTVPEDARAVIKPWHERESTTHSAESDTDDEMIIHIPFAENVRVRSVLLKLGRGELAPGRLRIYANRPNIVGFEEASSGDLKPHLDIRLRQDVADVTEYPLRAPTFANIHSLSLFFNQSAGGNNTRVYYIGFKGSTQSQKKDADQKLEIRAENASDAKLIDRLQEKAAGQQTTAR